MPPKKKQPEPQPAYMLPPVKYYFYETPWQVINPIPWKTDNSKFIQETKKALYEKR